MSQKSAERRWEKKLHDREILPLRPKISIGIKRDVHELLVEATANRLANAFHQVMMDPNTMFGYIKVIRAPANVGTPFKVGERFQGRYDLAKAILDNLSSSPLKFLIGPIRFLLTHPPVQNVIDWIDDRFLSDYGEIQEIKLGPPQRGEQEIYQLRYAYVTGSPIAGSSTFTIVPTDGHNSRLTQIFLYQEVSSFYIKILSKDGIRFHNQVVYMQTKKSADAINARITFTTIPKEYQDL
ncbi:MAG: hypothetical protein ACREOO_03720 [bacterium]